MDFSARIRKEAKHYGVRPDWLVMADLRSVGYSDAEAYSIVHQDTYALSASSEITLRDKIVKTTEYKNLVQDRINLLKSSKAQAVADDISLITPEQVAKELLRSAFLQPEGSKERADILMKYDDITRKNQEIDTSQEDDGGILMYMPLKCRDCQLLYEYNERKEIVDKRNKIES